jgi:hypothetical protein
MTVRRRVQPYDSDARYCGARKRQPTYPGETCRRPSGWGTWHVGIGHCELHGGARGYKHGRYSRVAREHMLPAVRRQMADYCIRTLFACHVQYAVPYNGRMAMTRIIDWLDKAQGR